MPAETLIIERLGQVEWLTLNRPHRLNAITPEMAGELADYVDGLHQRPEVRVVVMKGAGRAFCAGLDITARLEGENTSGSDGLMRLPDIVRGMRSCPQPIIAAINGAAAGGGFAFALAADVRLAAASARMNDAFVKLGVSGCELGLSYFLPRYVGASVAAELMYTGRFIDAERAMTLGLVSAVVPDDELDRAAESLAKEMLRIAPTALRKTKETLNRCLDIADLDAVIRLEEHTQAECIRGPDFEEGLRAFAEKRDPVWATDSKQDTSDQTD